MRRGGGAGSYGDDVECAVCGCGPDDVLAVFRGRIGHVCSECVRACFLLLCESDVREARKLEREARGAAKANRIDFSDVVTKIAERGREGI